MLDATTPDRLLQRAHGAASVTLGLRDGATVVGRLLQSGSGKAMLPNTHGCTTEVVFLNTAGGLTGGDRLSLSLTLGDRTAAIATTQTAERAYRAGSGTARMDVALAVGAGAALHWLPQETILFDRSALARSTRIDMAPDATVLITEMIVLGRAAMGETVRNLHLSDRREVWAGATPVWIDRFTLGDATLAARPALLDGCSTFATLALIGQGAEDALVPVRAAMGDDGAASAWNGRCIVRLASHSAFGLRRAVVRVLGVLRRGAPLPRVWQA